MSNVTGLVQLRAHGMPNGGLVQAAMALLARDHPIEPISTTQLSTDFRGLAQRWLHAARALRCHGSEARRRTRRISRSVEDDTATWGDD
jgi:hypothetical protein